MFELKALTKDAVPAALAKAERYRLLNEPAEAESICLDVLQVEPGNQEALVTRLLALTDQFVDDLGRSYLEAEEILPRLAGEYDRLYYAGIISERRAKALASRNVPGSNSQAYRRLRGGDAVVREGGGPATGRQRRRVAAVESMRAIPAAAPAPCARAGGTGRTATRMRIPRG